MSLKEPESQSSNRKVRILSGVQEGDCEALFDEIKTCMLGLGQLQNKTLTWLDEPESLVEHRVAARVVLHRRLHALAPALPPLIELPVMQGELDVRVLAPSSAACK